MVRGAGKPAMQFEDRAPHPERVSEDFADERIARMQGWYDDPKAREGLENVSRALKEHQVPAAMRLHLVAAVANLGRIASETRISRLERAFQRPSTGRGSPRP